MLQLYAIINAIVPELGKWEWSLDDALPPPDAYILCGLNYLITLLASVRCHDLDDCDANSNMLFALSVSFQ